MAMAAEVTGVAAAASECGISQRPHPHLPSLGFCEGKQVGGAEREWRRGTAKKGGREGGEKARERSPEKGTRQILGSERKRDSCRRGNLGGERTFPVKGLEGSAKIGTAHKHPTC
ncbi:unnamed protein product [Coccothraustes coccothraustes]